jgi:hypothetical protein
VTSQTIWTSNRIIYLWYHFQFAYAWLELLRISSTHSRFLCAPKFFPCLIMAARESFYRCQSLCPVY